MVNWHSRNISKVARALALFNLLLLAIDWVILYFASRQIKELYENLGLDAIYRIGAFNIQIRSGIVVLTSLAVLIKFWEIKGRSVEKVERVILAIVLGLLFYTTYIVLKIFFETIGRL